MRNLIFDEIFCQFYDEGAIGDLPAGSWPKAEPVAGDVVRTVEGEYPVHRAAIVNALTPLGLRLGFSADRVHAMIHAEQ